MSDSNVVAISAAPAAEQPAPSAAPAQRKPQESISRTLRNGHDTFTVFAYKGKVDVSVYTVTTLRKDAKNVESVTRGASAKVATFAEAQSLVEKILDIQRKSGWKDPERKVGITKATPDNYTLDSLPKPRGVEAAPSDGQPAAEQPEQPAEAPKAPKAAKPVKQ